MTEKNTMSKWELGCIIFNSLIYKMFTGYSESFIHYGGSAAWLTSLTSGIVFLLVLTLILKVCSPIFKDGIVDYVKNNNSKALSNLIKLLIATYFAISIYYALSSAAYVLNFVSYTKSPVAYIVLFLIVSALVSSLLGEKSIRRLYSLNTLGIGLSLIIISVLSFRYADIFNIFPLLGNGPASVFGKGLCTLFMYTDIIVIFFLPQKDGSYSFKKVTFWSALSAVLINLLVVSSISLNMPYELSEGLSLPIYPLTKAAALGKLPIRLDLIYQLALISSSLLYISLGFSIILRYVRQTALSHKSTTSVLLCLCLCFFLCSCYDSKEVEEKAYIIALGIDKGNDNSYKYTFQISNPLQSGGSIGAEIKTDENSSDEDKNKTVDNVIIESESYYTARDKLKGYISKETDISHLKTIVYSYDVAYEDNLNHSKLLLSEREVRPGTNLCLAKSAEEFLTSVKPTLEENTVRYYELFFNSKDIPYAPTSELRDFVGRSVDIGYDAVLPISDDNRLSGMGIFSNGILKELVSDEDVFIYKLLCGKLPPATFNNKLIRSKKKSDINVTINKNIPEITIDVYIASDKSISSEDISQLQTKAYDFLNKISLSNSDILGCGRYIKSKCITQTEWNSIQWNNIYTNSQFSINIFTDFVNSSQNLQNNQ